MTGRRARRQQRVDDDAVVRELLVSSESLLQQLAALTDDLGRFADDLTNTGDGESRGIERR